MRQDDFIGQQFYWFTGEVEDVQDPKKMNRVRVRCHGYYGNADEVATTDLPWATVMMPSTSQSSKGFGRTHELEVGSWVIGFFRDGSSAQDPLVMGSIATSTADEVGPMDVHRTATTDIPEETQANYPDNKVYKSKSGHIVEFDNTDGAERINIRHRTGSNFSIDSNGDTFVDSTASGGEIFIWSNSHITVNADEDIKVVSTGGKVDITATDDITIKSTTKTRVM